MILNLLATTNIYRLFSRERQCVPIPTTLLLDKATLRWFHVSAVVPFSREIDTLFIMIIQPEISTSIKLVPDIAFYNFSASWRGNTFTLATISLSVGLKNANLFLIRLPYSYSHDSCLDFFFLHRCLEFKHVSLWGYWGNSETPKCTTKICKMS